MRGTWHLFSCLICIALWGSWSTPHSSLRWGRVNLSNFLDPPWMTSEGPMICMRTLEVESGLCWSPSHTKQAPMAPHTQHSWGWKCRRRLVTSHPEVASWYRWAHHPETTAPKQTSSLPLPRHQTPIRETRRRTQQRPSRVFVSCGFSHLTTAGGFWERK